MEHDGNSTPWKIMAEERGLVIKRLDFDPHTYQFDLRELDSMLTERTRFAAINAASNVLGTINDVTEICRRVREAGGMTYVDAVQYTPHVPVDVQALGCDFLVCSAYKFFGPHQGVLWGREEALDRLRPYKLRAAPNGLPDRLETGCPSFEGQAGTLGAVDYIEWVGETMAGEFKAAYAHLTGRRRALHAAMSAMGAYEQELGARLIAGLKQVPGVVIHGITDPAKFAHRVPTVSITVPGVDPGWIAGELARRGVFLWNGSAYALDVVERLDLADKGGFVRFGPAHYNTVEEVDYAIACLQEILVAAPRGGLHAAGH
jgi:cysteine desulfurase family protein (TIGR01976 family)